MKRLGMSAMMLSILVAAVAVLFVGLFALMEFARPQQTTVAKADASAPQQIEPLVGVRTDEPIKPTSLQ